MKASMRALSLVCLCVIFATLAWSQSSFTAAVRGTVTDSSGAAVVAAKVTIIEAERNVAHTATTDEAGRYVITALPPGGYTLAVEAKGFKKFLLTNIPLAVQQQATLDAALQVGDISTSVEVASTAPLLNTTMASLGQVIDTHYMATLPNIGRNPLAMLNLSAGVVGVAGATSVGTSTNFVANGSRNSTSDILVDGAIVNTTEQNTGATDLKYTPSVDAVQEVKMQTNFFSAEYAQSGGAVVNMITRSGSNNFHGTAYEFYRDSNLNANSWGNNRVGAPKSYYQRHQLGGVIGGPIRKNKTFFFATFEYTHSKSPQSQNFSVPTEQQRNGDFSGTYISANNPITLYNPFDTYKDASGATKRNPFPGNAVPKSMMDPVALKALAFVPKANSLPTNAVTNANNWFEQGMDINKTAQTDFKVDHSFRDNLRATARWSYSNNSDAPPNTFGIADPAIAAAYQPNNGPATTKTQSASGNLTWTQNASTVWVANYGFIYANYVRNPFVSFDQTTLGLPASLQTTAAYKVFPTFSFGSGFNDIGTQGWLIMDRQEGVHQPSLSMTKIKGAHTIKAGAEYRHNFLDYAQPGYPSGQYTFSQQVTSADLSVGNSLQGNGFASFLLGWGNGGQFAEDPKAFSRAGYWGFFVQDDWKITRNLTLNLGLRYELEIPRTEVQNRYSYWDMNAPSPISVPGYNLTGVYKFVDNSNPSPFDKDTNNFGPRVGFAYALNSKTSLRAGGGVFYTLSRATVAGHTGSPFSLNPGVTWSLDSNATRYATLANPYPAGLQAPLGTSMGTSTLIGQGGNTILRQNVNPEMYSWNVSLQREVGFGSMVEINYTGSRGLRLYLPYTNGAPLLPAYWGLGRTALNAQVANPFYGIITDPKAVNLNGKTVQYYRLLRNMPQYDGVTVSEPNAADSNYHALQVKYEKRFSKGVTMLMHYTFSKMIDNDSTSSSNLTWLGGNSNLQDPFNLHLERSVSSNNIPHRFIATGAYELPFGRGKQFGNTMSRPLDGVLGGWQVSAMFTLQSGPPLQIGQNAGTMWVGNQRPNLLCDPTTSGSIYDRMNNYLNAACFSAPAADTLGTAPRYLNVYGPKLNMLDAALLKDWNITERKKLEFRAEATNLRNHPIFSQPGTTFGAAGFGQITGTKVGSRAAQISLKFIF